MRPRPPARILVYRMGSIGDFVVALPGLHRIRHSFPAAEIRLLTNHPHDRREVSARSVLDGTGLVDDYIAYPVGTRSPRELWTVRRAIRAFAPDRLIYLMAPGERSLMRALRDRLFFRWCGLDPAAVPLARSLRERLPPSEPGGLWESEARRLARNVAAFGPAEPELAASWDLRLSEAEIAEADGKLRAAFGGIAALPAPLVVLSIGTKQAIKDWGDDNWRAVLAAASRPHWGLVLVGAAAERERSAEVARSWSGPVANLCGLTSPRVSAAALRRARLFLGHDSGPMHLAAAVGTPCIVVFSKKNLPGEWYPFGEGHIVFYPPPAASSIRAIGAAEVAAAAIRALNIAEQPVRAETA
jgi:heptosyltransferase-3